MRPATWPEWLWAPLAAGAVTAAIGATGLWAGLPWLLPSLGPTIFLQVHAPAQPAARPYNVLAGQAAGAAAAAIGVVLTGAGATPAVLAGGELAEPRLWAAVIAVALTLLIQVPIRASHPPAAATALLIALGGLSLSLHDMGLLAAGVLLTAALGEAARRLRLARH